MQKYITICGWILEIFTIIIMVKSCLLTYMTLPLKLEVPQNDVLRALIRTDRYH
jgi:hypothetical protein